MPVVTLALLRGVRETDAGAGCGVFGFFFFAGGQHLAFAAAVAVNGNAFQSFLIGQQIDIGDILAGGFPGEIDCLGNRIIGRFLESRLHLDMPFRGYLMGGNKDLFNFLGYSSISLRWAPSASFCISSSE